MIFSKFGNKFTRPNGITQLMDDLGKANSGDNPNLVMLGGGNPAIIPEKQAHEREGKIITQNQTAEITA